MWPRVIEFMLACWLALSPFIFDYPKEARFFWVNDLGCSALIAFFSLSSLYPPWRKMHLCNFFVAFYLIVLAFVFTVQNPLVLGIIFLMLAIIPTNANEPPKAWRDFYYK